MKKINENQKVTLTLGQLKKLVRENTNGTPRVQPTNFAEQFENLMDEMCNTVRELVRIYGMDKVVEALGDDGTINPKGKTTWEIIDGTAYDATFAIDDLTADFAKTEQ